MNALDALKIVLGQHGFHAAAEYIAKDLHPRFAGEALRAWDHYPACMEVYPKVLKKPRPI